MDYTIIFSNNENTNDITYKVNEKVAEFFMDTNDDIKDGNGTVLDEKIKEIKFIHNNVQKWMTDYIINYCINCEYSPSDNLFEIAKECYKLKCELKKNKWIKKDLIDKIIVLENKKKALSKINYDIIKTQINQPLNIINYESTGLSKHEFETFKSLCKNHTIEELVELSKLINYVGLKKIPESIDIAMAYKISNFIHTDDDVYRIPITFSNELLDKLELIFKKTYTHTNIPTLTPAEKELYDFLKMRKEKNE